MKRDNNAVISSQIKQELIKLSKNLKRLPVKRDSDQLYYKAKKAFGTWNRALLETFGKINVIYKTDKQEVVNELLNYYIKYNELPKASYKESLTCRAKKHFGSWNKALKDVLGEVNQNRYGPNIGNKIIDFVKKYQRLPLRKEFDGDKWPYWEAVTASLGVKKWSEVFSVIDLTKIKYFHNTKHGYGSIFLYDNKIYLSREEFLIGKYLTEHNILFEKEVPYGNSNNVFDFYLTDFDAYIEYFGIATKDYKNRIEEKRKFYNGRIVIEIFKHDNTIKKLALEVQRL